MLCQSLEQIRGRLKKPAARGFQHLRIAALEASNVWNRATIGVVSISESRDNLDGLMKNVERAATRIANNHRADIADSFVDYL